MKISNDKVVSIEYTLKNADGQIIDTSVGNAPLEYIHGRGYLISGLEKDLEGKSEGEEFTSEIEPKDAYGEFDESMVVEVDRKQFPEGIEIEEGMQFEAEYGQLVTVKSVTKKLGIKSYKTLINTGKEAGQEVFHLHIHILAGRIH